MAPRFNWEKANLIKAARKHQPAIHNERVDIVPDAAFWKAWKEDREAIKNAGYKLHKTPNGWRVTTWRRVT